MHTIEKARAWAIAEFRRAGVESSVLSSDLLLGFVTGRDRVHILSHSEDGLPAETWNAYRSLVLRHAKGEPLQYLTGEREFFGLDFHVNPTVLIPRPETELLVETALGIIRKRFDGRVRFVDVGTGSGCIAVSIAHEIPASKGWATDISEPAIGVARRNALRHKVSDRIQFILTDLLNCFSRGWVVDMILSNPPYVSHEEYDTLPSGVRDHEPKRALFGGLDGMDFYRRLIPAAKERLRPGGYVIVEVGAGQADRIGRLIGEEGLVLHEILSDLQGIPRCIIAQTRRD